jgi:multidrug efflux pump subunit AcrB
VSLLLMYQIGLPIHQMSVTGLVVALGLLVDGSIVMTDEVRKRLLAGNTAGCDHALRVADARPAAVIDR